MKVADLFAKLGLKPDLKSFNAGEKLISGVNTALAGLSAYLSVSYFKGLISDTSATADKFRKMSQAVGIGSETLQELDHAAGLSGTNIESVSGSVQKLSKLMLSAAEGNKAAKEEFRSLGIAYKNSNGSLKTADEVMGNIADKVASMPDGTEKTAIAMKLFGRSGTQLIPMLNAGSQGIAEMRQEARELGLVISDETGKEFEAFNDDQDRIQKAFRGIRNEVVVGLLPQLRKLAEGVVAWVKANRQIIKQRLHTILKILVSTLTLVGKGIAVLVRLMETLRQNSGLVAAAIAAITAMLIALKMQSIVTAIASAAAWIAALLPYILIAAAILAVILILEDLYIAIRGGDSALKDLWMAFKEWLVEGVGRAVDEAIDGWKRKLNEFFEWIGDKLGFFGIAEALGKENARENFKERGGILLDKEDADRADEFRRAAKSGDRAAAMSAFFGRTSSAKQPPNAEFQAYTPEEIEQFRGEIMGAPSIFGGKSSTSTNVQQSNSIIVNMPQGTSPQDARSVATAVEETVARFWRQEMRAASAATGQ